MKFADSCRMNAMTESDNFYDLLHVQQSAPAAIIKHAYRAIMLSMKQHPDLGGDTDKAALINKAYETLSDANKRAVYDQMLASRRTNTAPASTLLTGLSNAASNGSAQYQETAAPQQSGARCAFCYRFHNTPSTELLDCSDCGSPLDPPPTGLLTDDAARSIERVPKNISIQVTETIRSRPTVANLQDLSPQGLGFILDRQLSPRQVVRIGCALFEGIATIAHRRPAENGDIFYGAQFLTLRFHNASGNFISTLL